MYAAVRGNFKEQVSMQFTTARHPRKVWTPLSTIGFYGDAPSFTRLKSGEILLSTKGYFSREKTGPPYTALHISNDECKTWHGPYLVDKSTGAYSSTIKHKDKTILVIFYQEGTGSGIGAMRFIKPLIKAGAVFMGPKPLKALPF